MGQLNNQLTNRPTMSDINKTATKDTADLKAELQVADSREPLDIAKEKPSSSRGRRSTRRPRCTSTRTTRATSSTSTRTTTTSSSPVAPSGAPKPWPPSSLPRHLALLHL